MQKCIWCCTLHFVGALQKCIFASNAFANQNVRKRQNAFWRTFSKENVQLCKNAFWCKNAFDAKMHLMQKCIWCFAKCWAQNAFWQCNAMLCDAKCIFATHQMHFCNASNAFLQQNVQRTFYKVKCSASHFPKENVQQTKMLESGKMLCFLLCKKQRRAKMHLMHKMHFGMQKYIFQRKMFSKCICIA